MFKMLLCFIIVAVFSRASEIPDVYTRKDLNEMQQRLAQEKGRFASLDLKKYSNHYTMMAYREATGSSEVHEHEADIFIVEEGDAIIVTGGKMVGAHATKPGEIRGSSVEGGVRKSLKAGDIIHIPAGVPHQILVTPGKPISYFVVKVTGQ